MRIFVGEVDRPEILALFGFSIFPGPGKIITLPQSKCGEIVDMKFIAVS